MKVSFVLQLLFATSSHREKKTRMKHINLSIYYYYTQNITISNDHALESSCKVIANISL